MKTGIFHDHMPHSINMWCSSFHCGGDVGVQISFSHCSTHLSLPNGVIYCMQDMGQVPGLASNVSFSEEIKREVDMGECAHPYSACLAWELAYWSCCLTSSLPPGCVWSLCFALRAKQSKQVLSETLSFSSPWQIRLPPAEQRKREPPPLCSGSYSTRVVPNQGTEERRRIHWE